MPTSSRRTNAVRRRPLAVVLLSPGQPVPRWAARLTRAIVVRRVGPGIVPRRLPAAPLVLVALRERTLRSQAPLARLRAASPDQRWYGIARSGRAAAPWAELIDDTLDAPTVRLLELLAAGRGRERGLGRQIVRLRSQQSASDERLALLSDTIQAAGSLLDPGMVARFIMERAGALAAATRWRLYRIDEIQGLLRLDAHRDVPGAPPPAEAMPLETGLAGWVARHRQALNLEDARGDARLDRVQEWASGAPQALIALPLVSRGRVIGVAELADPRGGRFSAPAMGLVATLLEPAAIAMDNALLFRKLEERTVTDDLTHLYNARFMENYLRRETKRAARFHRPVSLLFIDLDGFKSVNDVHGHMAGSRTLVEVGEILRLHVREVDVAARWGGDEFALVLPETSREGAVAMAERVRRMLTDHVYLQDQGLAVRISASIGVAVWPEHGQTAEELLAAADAAMYRVKDHGKNGVQLARGSGEWLPMQAASEPEESAATPPAAALDPEPVLA